MISKVERFFLLPKEPEYTVQSLSREFSNIQALISLAISLPVDCTLIVKSIRGWGFESLSFITNYFVFRIYDL